MEASTGFEVTFTIIQTPCGPHHRPLREESPLIQIDSPTAGSSFYMENLNCLWKITTAENEIIRITFDKFDIQESNDGLCTNDYLEIHDEEVKNLIYLLIVVIYFFIHSFFF